LLRSLDLLLEMVGPTPEVTALMRRHRGLAGETDDGRPLAMPRRGDASLIRTARRQADAGDAIGFVETIETLVGATGPTPELASLIRDHRDIIEQAGAGRLMALMEGPAAVAGTGRGAHVAARHRIDPAMDPLLRRLRDDLVAGDVGAISHALQRLARERTFDDRVRQAVEEQARPVLERLAAQRTSMDPRTLAAIEKRLIETYAREAWVRQAMAKQREDEGALKQALRLYEGLADTVAGAAPALFHAATLAGFLGEWDTALSFARRAIGAAPKDRALVAAVAGMFADRGRPDDAETCWRMVDADGPLRMWVRLGLTRLLENSPDQRRVANEVLRTLRDATPFEDLSVADQNYLIDIVRRLIQAQGRTGADLGLVEAGERLEREEPPSALREWILAGFEVAGLQQDAALGRLDRALANHKVEDGVLLDLHAEKALILARYHLYGEAVAEEAQVPEEMRRIHTHYGRRFAILNAVAALCPDAAQPLRYPECLIDLALAEAAARPIVYEPNARHVTMVSGSLGQGGGERQAITVVRRVLGDDRVAKLNLLVRSTHMRANDDFFLADARALPLDLTVYGQDWLRPTTIAETLPELADRPRLVAALDLMPHNLREEVSRLVRLFLDQRPQAVHIWQDIYQAALACVIAGVPRFFIHRGSLAPNFWAQNEYQTATHFRPMRHAYRRLLERPDFVLANNSITGCETDRAWVEWPDSAPFQVIYNAVDFNQLGVHTGRNFELRRQLGVPDDAVLVGGSFRIVEVKRPLYWIEAARRIREAVPGTHFLIIGDGEMTESVQAHAEAHGFADALHLPGRVSNVGDWYRAMDLKLLTSEREGIPNALIEAQHFGVPIIATQVGGIHEAIDIGETGFVIPGDDGPGPYADKTISVLKDRDWHEAARIKAPAFVHEKFSLDKVVNRLMGYYGVG
jgi:glycosyltransferase involved in cell wall biosynthesis/tetratricopeptide (TPR) repeat protein